MSENLDYISQWRLLVKECREFVELCDQSMVVNAESSTLQIKRIGHLVVESLRETARMYENEARHHKRAANNIEKNLNKLEKE